MSRLVHLSDLHFGRDRPDLMRPLIGAVNDLQPDLIAISGDFTQRARRGQYRAARAFLDHLEAPVISVPGNHDVPFANVLERFLQPWRRYRRYIDRETQPERRMNGLHVVGLNTVNPLYWQRGHMSRGALRRVRNAFAEETDACRVVMCHHPLEHPPGSDKALMRGARQAVPLLSRAGADVVLSGHLHRWRAAPVAAFGDILLIHAGTGLSTRARGEPNDFNLIEIDGPHLTVTRHAAPGEETRFVAVDTVPFVKQARQWMQGRAAASPRRAVRVAR